MCIWEKLIYLINFKIADMCSEKLLLVITWLILGMSWYMKPPNFVKKMLLSDAKQKLGHIYIVHA